MNKSVCITTMVIGIGLAAAGMHHGFFEILQGSKKTSGIIIQAISPEYQRWKNGEEALTVIPSYLWTGIAATAVSAVIVLWSVTMLKRKYGITGFLLLFILLTLFGGGIGHLIFFLSAWAYGTRINKPLNWWRKVLKGGWAKYFGKVWPVFLVLTVLFFLIVLEISVFGIPGMDDQAILTACWSFLLAAFALLHITYISAFARDIGA